MKELDHKCCGKCKYASMHDKDLLCHVNPPVIIPSDNGSEYFRFLPIEPEDPPCHLFTLRMDS